MNPIAIESFTKLLQLSISPIVLISGAGLFLLSINNRLARTIDRSRELAKEMKTGFQLEGEDAKRQLPIFIKRSEHLRKSVTCILLSMFFSGTMIIGLFLLLFLEWHTEPQILSSFFLSVLSLILSVVYFLMDIFLTLKALRLEVGKYVD